MDNLGPAKITSLGANINDEIVVDFKPAVGGANVKVRLVIRVKFFYFSLLELRNSLLAFIRS
jgi:hypothetical protein